jgi:hypothetical protein
MKNHFLGLLLLTLIVACNKGSDPQTDLAPTTDGPVVTGDGPVVITDGPRRDGPRSDKIKVADGKSKNDLYPQRYLTFNESLCSGIADGSKKSTLRNKHVTYIVAGDWIRLICSTSKTTFKGHVTMVRLTTWGGITPAEYQADGFSSQAQMLQIMQTYYPGIALTDPATVVTWDQTSPYP